MKFSLDRVQLTSCARFSHSYQRAGGLWRAAGLKDTEGQDVARAWGMWSYPSYLGVSLYRQRKYQGAGSCPCGPGGIPRRSSRTKEFQGEQILGTLDRKGIMDGSCLG